MMYTMHDSRELEDIITKAATKTDMRIRDMGADIEAGGSDHESFWDKGVTAVMFHTGVNADTHQVTDDTERIDFDKMEQVTKLVFQVGYDVANRRERIKTDKHK
jgi:pyridoxine 5'-phosphate synthase PdxJ